MPKTIEPRSLLSDVVKPIDINEEIIITFIQWQNLFEEKLGHKGDELDAFFAGWVISNPMVRDQFKKLRRSDVDVENLIKVIRRK